MADDDLGELVERVLDEADLDWDRVGEQRWTTMLSGEWKRTIPVLLHLDDRTLMVQSLLCGVPDEGHREVYALVLHRNERQRFVHFALDDVGDVIMTGRIPRAALDEDLLGQILGELLSTADESFNSVLRLGFAGYIDREQAWRAKNDLPPNPVSDAP